MKYMKKRIIAILLVVVVMISVMPQSQRFVAQAAEKEVTLSNLGKLGTLEVGNKIKSGNWWQMHVAGADAFCLNLGYTCHAGDVYQSESDTYSSNSSGKKGKMACVGYWYDEVRGQSKKAYVMAQALFWALEEGVSKEDELKNVIKVIKKNTQYFENKTAAELYNEIFNISQTVTAKVKKWKYTGSGSHRQELLVIYSGNTTQTKPKSVSKAELYRQRITLEKRDEEGMLLPKVTFTVSAKNIDELYSFYANGWGNSESENVDEDMDCFELTKQTSAKGRIAFRFTYRIQSEDYYYYTDAELASMSSEAKKEAKENLKANGYRYASDLSYAGAINLAEIDLQSQIVEISNEYIIKEEAVDNKNLLINSEYKTGKKIVLNDLYSWTRTDSGEWPEVTDKTYSEYSQAYALDIINKYKKATIKINKKDGYSEDGKAYGNANLDGAVFAIYEDAACTKKAILRDANGKRLSNREYAIKNGTLETDYLKCGVTYYAKEIKSPKGYCVENKVIPISLDGQLFQAEYTKQGKIMEVSNSPVLGKVAIQKYYSEGKTGMLKAEPGVEFEIYLKERGSFENASEYERDCIVTDENGYAITKNLYYGTYKVHQRNTGETDTEKVEDFFISINENGKIYKFTMNDNLFQAYLQIVKKDKNTQKTVLKPGTVYQIYKVDENSKKEILVTQSYSNGNQMIQVDRFQTNEKGVVMTIKPVPSGIYRIYEMDSASGLHINSSYIQVEINSKKDNYTQHTDGEGNVYMTVEVMYPNEETYGKFSLYKTGEQLTDYDKKEHKFIYEEKSLEGAVFEIYAKKDIYTQDNQGDTWFKEGELVGRIITGVGVEFTKECGGITGYEVEEAGVISITLPLGKYRITEIETAYGYVLSENHSWDLEFAWENATDEYVLNSTDATDEKGLLKVKNDKARGQVEIKKIDKESSQPISGVMYGVYTKDDIYNALGERIVEAGEKIEELITDDKGKALTQTEYPLMSRGYGENSEKLNSGKYFLRELNVSDSYFLDDKETMFHFEYKDKTTGVVSRKIVETNNHSKVTIDKLSLAKGEKISGCSLEIRDEKDRVIVSWISGIANSPVVIKEADTLGYRNLSAKMNAQGSLVVGGLLKGKKYRLIETKPADGFVTAESMVFSVSENEKEENKVVMYDDTTKVDFRKIDGNTKKMLGGAGISVFDSTGKKVYSFTSQSQNAERIDGVLKVGETYLFREEQVPEGYQRAEDVSITIRDTSEVQEIQMSDSPLTRIPKKETPKTTIPETKVPKTFKEREKEDSLPSPVPLTGDNANWANVFGLMMLSLLGIIILKNHQKCKMEKNVEI